MEVEEIQAQGCNISNSNSKFPRNKLGQKGGHDHHYPDDEDSVGDQIKRPSTGPTTAIIDAVNINNTNNNGGGNRLRGWPHPSRIIRVSRASGGKDRHSKVWTSKGLRDRRVRLSVTTAIQFYDLQDRLGCDQPSKAVEWLINAASEAIAELPSLNSAFPDTPKQLSDEKREQGFDSAEVELELDQGEANYQQQNQHLSLSKSACSSTSETSKGSGLSLSRSDIRVNRVKARERARERAAKEKEKETSDSRIPPHQQHQHHHHQNMNPISQNTPSFTELLTGGISNVNSSSNNNNNNNDSSSPTTASEPNSFHKTSAAGTTTSAAAAMQMDYFPTGLFSSSAAAASRNYHSSGFAGLPMSMQIPPPFSIISGGGDSHAAAAAEALPHFSFVPEQLIAATSSQPNGNGGDYSLNFSISSSGLAGFNRGTLQSNSSPSSLLPHLQRFASPIDGTTNVPFFIGAAAPAASPLENHHHHHHHHQFPAGFDGRLHFYYGDGNRHSDQKGKGKN
ncbi:hypothetical protein TIFTF001_012399 [Ficus carica]|uniref:Transcription factor TCP2-like n=1 Tax=Ficus carica TaxID=3494 RepID=A0AA88D689_FICCA|nr:hypothetical protein TIFTF001_012399 [Ficus carica]